MSVNSIIVFVHVISAIGYSAGTLLSLFGLLALRRAHRVEEARSIVGLLTSSGAFFGISLLLTVAAGVYLAATTWGWQLGWINVTLASLILVLFPLGAVVGMPRSAIASLLNELPDGPLPQSADERIHDPLFGTAVYVVVALLLGIVFLMTTRPALDGSVIVILVSVVLGVALSLPMWRG